MKKTILLSAVIGLMFSVNVMASGMGGEQIDVELKSSGWLEQLIMRIAPVPRPPRY